ncbi:MAG: hypothetical protein PHC64_06685 [Candidatus Gastranaerophilales bacterium]|nr:hypothetical protein [Candidatus Gastranaerophilales bacterium]
MSLINKNKSTYQQAIDILTSQGKFYINLGLERVQKIIEILNEQYVGIPAHLTNFKSC